MIPPITILDLGSCPVDGQREPYTDLPITVPGSKIIAVDITHPERYADGWEAHKAIIAGKTGRRNFHRGLSSVTSSLYPLDQKVIGLYSGLEECRDISSEEVETISLDDFSEPFRPIHFIRADIQGAEAEAFEGGPLTLTDTLMIVCEVLFAPLYKGGAVFRDTDAALSRRGFEFYMLIHLAGRAEAPFDASVFKSHCRALWGDAIYVRRDVIAQSDSLDIDTLRRAAVLADLYKCYSLAAVCIDKAEGRTKANEYIANRMAVPASAKASTQS